MWTNRHSSFINTLFEELNQNNIHYFVLRNYEELPNNNSGKDVDIVIEPGSYGLVKNALLTCMKRNQVPYYSVSYFDRMRCWYIMDSDTMFGIHIDIIENEVYKGYEYFDFEYLYTHVVPYKNFYALDKSMDTVMLIAQNIVAYKSLKQKYRDTITANYADCKTHIDEEICKFWSKNVASRMISCLEREDYDAIVNEAKYYEKEAKKSIFRAKPLKTSFYVSRFLLDKVWRVIVCPKKYWRSFAVEAPDGTGKTTFLNQLIQDLGVLYVCGDERFNVYHFRPSFLPNLGAAGEKAGVMKQDKDFTNPHRAKPVGFVQSMIRMTYYWLDYLIGTPVLLRKDSQYGHYTIFDRYIYDFLVDPERTRIKLPYWIRKIFTKLVVEPRIVFVLQTTPDVIYKRKQELTYEEIEKQLKDFSRLVTSPRFVPLDAGQTPEQISKDALKIILDKFMKKAY